VSFSSLLTSIVLVSFFGPLALAQVSAARDPKISGAQYLKAVRASLPKRISTEYPKVVVQASFSVSELATKTEQVVSFPESLNLHQMFNEIRDERFLSLDSKPEFPRRLSWLYPADGCFTRAEYMSRKLQGKGAPAPTKVYAFGSLRVATPNSASGIVTWWYHVVVGYKVDGQVMVFDPAIDPAAPLSLRTWLSGMVEDISNVKVSFCDANSFDPTSVCKAGDAITPESLLSQQRYYLELEWDNMLGLGKDPEKVLGNLPPWKLQ